jgi:GNAT superfamily N-acetyltransferase
MVETKALITATLDAGLEFFRAPHGELSEVQKAGAQAERKAHPPVLVPIRSLAESHRERIAQHLLALDEQDRYLRFGYAAQEAQIRSYTDKLDFERDEIYGIYNRKLELIAMAHLAFASNAECKSCAEFGVSVLKGVRGRGYGARLFDRAVMHARNEGVDLMFIHALSENTAMLNIARNAGALVERDGSESEAYLKLPEATMDSRVTELVEDQFAEVDFQLKLQAKRFWEFLADVQSIREGVRAGRHKSAE